MTKIAFSSDNHLDLNKVDFQETMKQQAEYLIENNYQYYFFAGDLSNDFQKTLSFFEEMNNFAGDSLRPYFLAGNHDMGKGVSFSELEDLIHPQYLHRKIIEVNNKKIIGINGWYDYSFVDGDYSDEEIEKFKKGLWFDRVIDNGGLNDKERFKTQVSELKKADILITHFLPNDYQIKRFNENTRWDLVNALMGGSGVGNFAIENKFNQVIYGHMHKNVEFIKDKTTFNNVAVGAKKELDEMPFIEVWKNKLLTLEI